ncbi:hypothetical protein EVAR_53376_1 [Eumeta japonica]|uniref:Uncharacterized protein n=1 Tax=Eumeta variegata TaxID=151549 RepID=A0A4C1Y5B8_EUMVA|nr:hypothetical protein EVAR_53376_1 [Eumeta japonica]
MVLYNTARGPPACGVVSLASSQRQSRKSRPDRPGRPPPVYLLNTENVNAVDGGGVARVGRPHGDLCRFD